MTSPSRTDQQHHKDALLIWDYHQMGHALTRCDVGLGLGSHDLGVADHAARLYLEGYFPLLVFSGATSATTARVFPEGEAVAYRQRAIDLGVPPDRILVESRATNTGDNFRLARELLAERGIEPRSVLVISKPYMERRAFATAGEVWPGIDVYCSSDELSYDDYLASLGDEKLVIDMLVGDLQRVIEYPAKGFSIPQQVPQDVLDAYRRLVDAGYTSRLIGA